MFLMFIPFFDRLSFESLLVNHDWVTGSMETSSEWAVANDWKKKLKKIKKN